MKYQEILVTQKSEINNQRLSVTVTHVCQQHASPTCCILHASPLSVMEISSNWVLFADMFNSVFRNRMFFKISKRDFFVDMCSFVLEVFSQVMFCSIDFLKYRGFNIRIWPHWQCRWPIFVTYITNKDYVLNLHWIDVVFHWSWASWDQHFGLLHPIFSFHKYHHSASDKLKNLLSHNFNKSFSNKGTLNWFDRSMMSGPRNGPPFWTSLLTKKITGLMACIHCKY